MDTTELQLQIKEKFRLLVLANGGPTACERILSFPQSRISEAMSKHLLERMPRADHISILEASCGQLIVTGFMADLHGYDIELREHKAGDLGTAFASALKEIGEASSAVALSMGKAKIDEITKQRTIREPTEARDAIERLITTARAA
jgi:hypothetical protein